MSESVRQGDVGKDDERVGTLLDFWFDVDTTDSGALKRQTKRWFASTPEQDLELGAHFGPLAKAAAAGELDALAKTPRGRLALIILLDQLPRSLHRGTPAAFAQDPKALELCLGGMRLGQLDALEPIERVFFCMPLQHAESQETQALAVETFRSLAAIDGSDALTAALEGFADYAVMHRDIIERFGRFPHRNKILGRQSTEAELEFLESGGPSFGQ
jgi:uncharacterized protein (DUF924 family)